MKQDPTRTELPETGIFVRAQAPNAYPIDITLKWDSVDINHLDRESLIQWMADKDQPYLMALVLFLLGHEPTHIKREEVGG